MRPRPQARLEANAVTPFWRTRKALLLAGGAALLLAATVVGFVVLAPAGQQTAPTSGERMSKQLQDAALPTGLTISREASYDPSSGQTRLTVAYAAQKAPLSGEFLEVIPGLADGEACPAVTWDGASVSRNQASITGLDVECGWKLSGLEIPAGGSVQVTAKVSVSPADQQALDAWLGAGSEATAAVTQDPAVKGTAYPVQRLKGVEARTAARVVTASPLNITPVPVWAGGADELTRSTSVPRQASPRRCSPRWAAARRGYGSPTVAAGRWRWTVRDSP